MTQIDQADKGDAAGQPARRSPLKRILDERPEARGRLGRAIAALLGTALVALGLLGGLLVWHVRRRARVIRERLGPPRVVRWPEPEDLKAEEP